MGLDWCVENKTVEGKEKERARLTGVLEDLRHSESVAWNRWLEKKGHEKPFTYPNPVSEEWAKTSEGRAFQMRMDMLSKEMEQCVITSMQTLGAPQVGSDKEADDFVRAQWERYSKLREKYPTVEEYLEDAKGQYVPHLVESDGVSGITGMAAGSDSFRGKILGYMEWLPEDVRNQAYSSMLPDELVAYGTKLISLSDKAKKEKDAEVVMIAGKWCVFWGSHGHSMFAWY